MVFFHLFLYFLYPRLRSTLIFIGEKYKHYFKDKNEKGHQPTDPIRLMAKVQLRHNTAKKSLISFDRIYQLGQKERYLGDISNKTKE